MPAVCCVARACQLVSLPVKNYCRIHGPLIAFPPFLSCIRRGSSLVVTHCVSQKLMSSAENDSARRLGKVEADSDCTDKVIVDSLEARGGATGDENAGKAKPTTNSSAKNAIEVGGFQGGIACHIASRDLMGMRPSRVVVPRCYHDRVAQLIQMYRELDGSTLPVDLVGLDVGEELKLKGGYLVKPFRTYHVIPSQGYLVYSVRNKLLPQFIGLPGPEIKRLKDSGVELTEAITVPEVAFTGDTTAEFITDPANADVLRAKLLVMETTFINGAVTAEHARKWGHTHLDEVLELAQKFENQGILFIHFSARYSKQDIEEMVKKLPPPLQGRVSALTTQF